MERTSRTERLPFVPASPKKQVLTEKGASPQILIPNYNETATDALGRKLVTCKEAGFPKKDKYVGLFYLIWTDSKEGFTSNIDVTKAYACNPEQPYLGSYGTFCWWAEPETGYHCSDEIWQIKRDMRYFAMAGIDFIYLDFTNGYIYEKSFRALLDTCLALRAEGQMTPYIVPWAWAEADVNVPGYGLVDIYEMFYKDPKYADLWFYWEGKPLAMLKHDRAGKLSAFDSRELTDFFTFRISWPDYAWPGEPVGSGYKFWGDGWLANFEYFYGYTDDPARSECVGIGCAGFATPGSGRSGRTLSQREHLDRFLETSTMGEGIMLQENFEEMMAKNPETDVLIISRWNEWGAQNLNLLDFGFCDQFNREYSRDIEPMKGGFTDNYFYQMCNIIRRFKGVLPPDVPTGKQTVDLNGGFDQWQSILPVFEDFAGDTEARDHLDVSKTVRYQNATGRNDILETRLTADGGMIYAYVRTAAPITDYREGKNWMMLFIDGDNNKSTGWEGYDFAVNYAVIDETTTILCAYKDNVWQEIGTVRYRAEGCEMMLALPRTLLGLTEETFTLNFHWMDNVTDVYDLHAWFTTGDSAPERRNDYTLTLSIPYNAAEETLLPPRTEGTVAYMPAVSLTPAEEHGLRAGLRATLYTLPAEYGKMPDFDHIAANAQGSSVVSGVSVLPAGNRMGDFALSFAGYIRVPSDGVYEFALQAEDCARLYVDGRLAAEILPPTAREAGAPAHTGGGLRLAGGYHALRIEYAEIGGGCPSLSLDGEWSFYCNERMEHTMNYYIGIDLGTSSCKGILTNREGTVLAEHSVSYDVSYPAPGYSEQNPEDWYNAAVEILNVLSEGRKEEIKGIGIAGQMHGLVMLDSEDRVIRPAILWNDGRSEKQTAYLNSLGCLPTYTGNIAFAGFTAPKILWVKENEPENFAAAKKICLPKDYLAYRLTGVFSSEYSDAAGMLLLDVANKSWSKEMCDICGITVDMLPALYESYEMTGKLKAEYGLPNAILCAGAGDNAAAAIGTATLRDGDCSISLGTSGTVFLPCDEFNTTCGTALHNFAHSTGKFHLMGCILSAASCNKWWVRDILDTKYNDELRDDLGQSRVFFLPYLTGERCPHNDVNARGAFVGLSINTTQADMSLAVLEGVAYALRDCVEAGGVKIQKAVLCGGGAISPLWQAIMSGVLGADIYLTETEQGPSMGGALLAMTACGEYDSVYDAADATVRKTLAVKADPARTAAYNEGYAIYKKLYPALKDAGI